MKKNQKPKWNPEPETKSVDAKWQVKALENGPGEVSGYASVFGVVDLHGDIVARGAFAKTIRERVPAGKIKLLDSHVPDAEHTVGTIIEAREDEVGLWFRAELSGTQRAQEIREKMTEGHLGAASIGFDIIDAVWEERDGDLIRIIREVKLYEISVVPFPANEMAGIRAKSVVPIPFQGLPMADSASWNEAEARERVTAWAAGDDAKMRRAHLALIPGKGYDLLIADVVDGELMAHPLAIKNYLDASSNLREHALKYIGEKSSPTGPPSSTQDEEAETTDTDKAGPPLAPTSDRSTDHLKKSESRRRRLHEARLELASLGVLQHGSCGSPHQ